MLGKRPRPLLRTSSKLQPMPGDPIHCIPLIEKPKSPSPISGAPRQIIGFNPVSKDLDGGGSPRSVLDAKALSGIARESSKEKPARSPRSPRSGLEGLISSPRPWDKKGSEGVGLGIVAAMQAEEENSIGATKGSLGRLCQNVSFKCFPAARSPTQISQPIPIASKENRNPKASREGEHDAAFFRNHRAWRSRPVKTSCWDADSDEEMEVRESIFSTASPASCCHGNSCDFLAMDFLNACFFCKRLLGPGKDIFMYRGDRAFCSAECRYQQIVIDERKERCSAAAFKTGSNVFSVTSNHRNRVLATTTAAAA